MTSASGSVLPPRAPPIFGQFLPSWIFSAYQTLSCLILAWWHYAFPNINAVPASIPRPAILLSRVQFWHLLVWLSLRWSHLSLAGMVIFKLAFADMSLCKSYREALGRLPSLGQRIVLYIVSKSSQFWKETNVNVLVTQF